MKNEYIFKSFIFSAIIALLFSCKDDGNDLIIDNLENKVVAMSKELSDLQEKVDAGATITSVSSNEDGVKVTLSNGESFDLINGTQGTVITAGEDGFWYFDGVKSDKSWKGPGGGSEGGSNGIYFEPGEDGFWYKVDGDKKEKTTLEWRSGGSIGVVINELGDVEFTGVKLEDGLTAFTIFNNRILRSLVLIPDYYINGIEAINYATISYESCNSGITTISPNSVKVRYHVNPSSVTEDMILTGEDGLEFDYLLKSNLITRSEMINPTARFVSLKDGILTVELIIDTSEVESNNAEEVTIGNQTWIKEKLDMIALQVKLSGKALNGVSPLESVVTSNYGKVQVIDSSSPEVDRKGTLGDNVSYSGNFKTVETAKNAQDPYLVELPVNKEVNLSDSISSIIQIGEEIDINQYGLKYKFDLLDENENVIDYIEVGAEINHQDYIEVLDESQGTIKSKVLPGESMDAATGKNPIIRVQILDDDCIVSYGFIKIKLIESEDLSHYASLTETVLYGCEEPMNVVSSIEWMNENVYTMLGVSASQFHENQYLDVQGLYDENGILQTTLGTLTEIEDAANKLFNWSVNENIFDNAETVTGYVYYRSKNDNAATVKIKVTVEANKGYPSTSYVLSVEGTALLDWTGAESVIDMNSDCKLRNVTYIAPNGFNTTGAYKNTIREIILADNIEAIGELGLARLRNLEKIVLPNKLRTLGGSVFFRCESLKSLEFPETFAEVTGQNLFRYCSSLSTITIHATTPPVLTGEIGPNPLFGNTSMQTAGTLYVPKESVEAYKADIYWGTVANILPIQ